MEITKLTAISPIDGRYREKVDVLAPYFSEYGLIKYRVYVEIEYFIALCKIPLPQLEDFDPGTFRALQNIYRDFSIEDATRVKEIEKTTNHDVKSVEYFIKDKFRVLGLSKHIEFIHFGLTSQDVNNTAVPYSLKVAMNEVYYPFLEDLIRQLEELSNKWEQIPMLAHTHGQPASPTRLGKEIKVFSERLKSQLLLLREIPASAKFGGATGNFNAHHAAYPEINW
ncbi:MAG: lyase family protein, partial [bacterium]